MHCYSWRIAAVVLYLLPFAGAGYAQAAVNPDISFIGDARGAVSDHPGASDKGRLLLEFHELEVAADGYLNPYARASIKVSFGEEGSDVEEAYAVLLKGLPLRFQLKAGRYLVDLGRLNIQHPHQWLWVERPLMWQALFGEEGFKDVGFNLNTLWPLGDGAFGLSVNLLNQGGLITEETADAPFTPDPIGKAVSGRVSVFCPIGARTNLDLGVSALRAQMNPVEMDVIASAQPSSANDLPLADFTPEPRFGTVALLDGKLKWKRDEYTGLNLIGEYLVHQATFDEVTATVRPAGGTTIARFSRDVTTHGTFVACEVRFLRRFDAGVYYDYTQAANDENVSKNGTGVYGAFSMAEETLRFGLALRRNEEAGMDPYYSGIFQVLFSLGPHKPHQF